MSKNKPQRFLNRELSWLEFNARVLAEARRSDKPLLERLKFLSIVSANLDEFFMVRVASLKRQIRNGNYVTCPTKMSPTVQLAACTAKVREILAGQYECLHGEVLPALAANGLEHKAEFGALSAEQKTFAKNFFQNQVFPLLTPVRINLENPAIPGANLRLQVAFLLKADPKVPVLPANPDQEHLIIVQIPPGMDRVVFLPEKEGRAAFVLLETLLVEFAESLFPGYSILEHLVFRVTRDADFAVDENRDDDFVEAMEEVVTNREKSTPVRLTLSSGSDSLRALLQKSLGLEDGDVYEVPEPLELGSLMNLASIQGFDNLKDEGWPPISPRSLPADESIWDILKKRDILLHHPFESFDPVVRIVKDASVDPRVLAIKMTLYRTSGNSPIVQALETAAQNGKQVTVLVELKARFDEQRNISWAERLERAGVIVVYGIAQIKVHAKALLVIRQESGGIVRYLHLGTGNYNDRTARLYTDMGLMTSRNDLCYEAGLFFNAITGYSAIPSLSKLAMAPQTLKPKLLQLIEREASKSIEESPGRIIAKLNALADTDIIEALYKASARGVKIELNVRGICMLVPGVPGQSENIRVVSIIDRYLEHTRAFYFYNGGDEEIFLSSADWMSRNLERRVELLFPVEDPQLRTHILTSLELCLADNQQAYELAPDGTWSRVPQGKKKPVASQQARYELARRNVSREEAVNRSEFSVRRRGRNKAE